MHGWDNAENIRETGKHVRVGQKECVLVSGVAGLESLRKQFRIAGHSD